MSRINVPRFRSRRAGIIDSGILQTTTVPDPFNDAVFLMHLDYDVGIGETVSIAVDSIGGNNGTINSAFWTDDGHRNGSLSFVGDSVVNSYITLNNDITLDPNASSISLWFNTDSFGKIFTSNSSTAYSYLYPKDSTTIAANFNFNNFDMDFTVPLMSTGIWYHLVMTRDNGTLRLYLNGVESTTGPLSNGDPHIVNTIGTYGANPIPSLRYYGKLDEIATWDRTLTPTEITTIYNQGVPFSPYTISGLKLWLDARVGVFSDAGTTLAVNSDPAYQWNDQSENGNHLVQSIVGNMPIFKTGMLNGKPVISSDGVDDSMVTTFGSLLSQPNTIFIVFSITAGSFQKQFFDSADPSFINRHGMYGESSNKFALISGGTASELNGIITVPTLFSVYSIIFNNASSELFTNGVSGGTGNPGSDAMGGIRVFSNSTPAGWAAMDVAEILVYNSLLSNSQRMSVEAYLNTKYAIY